jgi:Fe-S cluster assembly iron-binding protein IscA
MMIHDARMALGLFSVALLLSGCRDAAGPPPISVAVSPTNASVTAATTQSFSATVANDARNAGVTWTLTGCSGSTCGILSTTSSASGDAVSYYAPATVPTPPTATVTAVSVTDNTKFGTATIDITPPAISVSVTPASVDVPVNAQQQVTATAANDLQNAGINWTVTGSGCSGAACGTLSVSHSASGAPITYTAPATWPNPATVTIKATSVTDNTRFATATVTITSLIVVSVSPTAAHVDVNAPQQLTSTLTNDPSNAGVTWRLGCSGAACGTLSATTSASGVAIMYTAPAAVPNASTVTVTATSVADGRKSAVATFTITSSVSVTVAPALAGVDVNTVRQFAATLANDPNSLGVTWTVSGPGCSGADCGTFSAASSASGVPVSYTAPATVPTPPTVTVTAGSVTDYTKSASAIVVITTPGIVSVGVAPTLADVNLSTPLQFTATAFNDPNNAGVTWTVTGAGCSGAACGTLSATSSASGAPVSYTAPAIRPKPDTVTVTATSVTDNSKSASAVVTITSLIQLSITPTGFVGVDVSTTRQFTATISNDPGNSGVTWTVSGSGCSGTACGTISPAGLYAAPATVPPPVTITVTATSVADYTKVAPATVVITTPGVITVVVFPSSVTICTVCQVRTRSFTAYVFNDPSNGGVAWSTGRGSISPTSSASGVPVTYTAPFRFCGNTFVRATSVADPTRSGSAAVRLAYPFCGR